MLDVRSWLIVLAARDEPPTEGLSELLSRLTRVGCEKLAPAKGSEALDDGEALGATGIAAVGPGFAFAESFEGEPAPLAAALERLCTFLEDFDQLRRIRLAAIDMREAAATARAIADRNGPARIFERVLETGMVVTYARPYVQGNKHGIGGRWRPQDADDRELHQLDR